MVIVVVFGGDNGYNLNYLLMYIIFVIVVFVEGVIVNDVVKKNVELNVSELVNCLVIIIKVVEFGKLKIFFVYYNLDIGVVDFL